jgi:putative tryptophan/tyrosine transport system substrate-binding protein
MRYVKTIIGIHFIAASIFLAWISGSLGAGVGPIPVLLLGSHNAAPYNEVAEIFERVLPKFGIDAAIEKHWLEGESASNLAEVLDRADKGGFRAILTLGSAATLSAGEKVSNTPIVAGLILDAEDLKGSRNTVGVFLDFPLEVQFQWIKRIVPSGRNVGVLYSPQKNQKKIEKAISEAGSMGINLVVRRVDKPADIPRALEDLVNKVDLLWGIADPVVYTPQTAKHILLFSLQNKIPLIGMSEAWVKAGALFALYADNEEIGTQCAQAMAAMLKQEKASGVSSFFPRKAVYAINLKIANQMSINIPEGIIRGACEVFR